MRGDRSAREATPEWVGRLCRVPSTFRSSDKSLIEVFEAAAPDLSDEASFVTLVRGELNREPSLLDLWITYSEDQRSSPAAYVLRSGEVGLFNKGKAWDVRQHSDLADACADFIYRTASTTLEHRRRPWYERHLRRRRRRPPD